MIEITASLQLDERELDFSYIRASGPGGQNVNKVATAVQLRFAANRSPSLPEDVRARLIALAGKRVTAEGILVIEAKRYRTQDQNQQDATRRLVTLIERAALPPRPRHKTKPTRTSTEERLQSKKKRGGIKKLRQSKSFE